MHSWRALSPEHAEEAHPDNPDPGSFGVTHALSSSYASPPLLAMAFAVALLLTLVMQPSTVDARTFSVDPPPPAVLEPVNSPSPEAASEPISPLEWQDRGGPSYLGSGVLQREALPDTVIPDRPRLRVITYTVQPGDTVFALADHYGISVETILWANERLQGNPDLLRVGEELVILPVSGVYHTVVKGDTIEKIARKYKVKPEAIISFEPNHLDPDDPVLVPGQKLIVPGGKKPPRPQIVHIPNVKIPKDASHGTGRFIWPTSGRITQRYWSGHRAIDIGAPVGTPVVAADSGYVIFAGWNRQGYGKLVIIDHGNGYRTYYAHLSSILVRRGESVGKGRRIGSVGSTGHSTGPHLHFEIRYHNIHKNPLLLLR
jgi:murein DD-endopeptidase MepM/ murein hydrolase activator NlpD